MRQHRLHTFLIHLAFPKRHLNNLRFHPHRSMFSLLSPTLLARSAYSTPTFVCFASRLVNPALECATPLRAFSLACNRDIPPPSRHDILSQDKVTRLIRQRVVKTPRLSRCRKTRMSIPPLLSARSRIKASIRENPERWMLAFTWHAGPAAFRAGEKGRHLC